MPPFLEGPIIVDRRFDGDALHELRDIGHGHRVNIVGASYDIPRESTVIKFPGNSSDALLGIARLIPIKDNYVINMSTDPSLKEEGVNIMAWNNFQIALRTLHDEGISLINDGRFKLTDDENHGVVGFYDLANSGEEQRLFVRTVDDLPFACASLVVGNSQRTK